MSLVPSWSNCPWITTITKDQTFKICLLGGSFISKPEHHPPKHECQTSLKRKLLGMKSFFVTKSPCCGTFWKYFLCDVGKAVEKRMPQKKNTQENHTLRWLKKILKKKLCPWSLLQNHPEVTWRLPMDVDHGLLALCTVTEDTNRATRMRKQDSFSSLGSLLHQ